MVEVKEKLMVCVDCLEYVNGDTSSWEAYYSEEEQEQLEKKISTALDELDGYAIVGEEREEFSINSCELCGSPLAGERHEVVVLST